MSAYIVYTDELMDFACHFLIEGEKGTEYSDEELIKAIEGARFQRLTRCKDCAYSGKTGDWLECQVIGCGFYVENLHFCRWGKPKEGKQ